MADKTRFCIFISHVHEEAQIAAVLRNWFHAAFPRLVTAFVSSDYEDNPLGKKWLDVIDGAMDRSRLLITLLSPQSINRMWIHLEAGWALGRKIDILPICHSGTKIDDLPRPYADYTGTEVERDDFARRLLMALKQRLKLDHPLPEGMLAGLANDVRNACAQCALKAERTESSSASEEADLAPLEIGILRTLAEAHDHGEQPTARQLARAADIRPVEANHHLAQLLKEGYIGDSLAMGEEPNYYIDEKGIEWLMKRGLL